VLRTQQSARNESRPFINNNRNQERSGLNARLKLAGTGILLCIALGLTIFCALQTVQAVQRFQQAHKLAVTGDVSTIRSWMTVPFIAHFYHVPESYLEESLHISAGESVRHMPLHSLADRVKRPLNSLIREIQHAILVYRKQHPGHVYNPHHAKGSSPTLAGRKRP